MKAEPKREGYERGLFRHWDDDDGDRCDTRCEILAAQRRSDGLWFSEWDGYSTDDTSELHVDHIVALAEAWDSGAKDWTSAERDRFADDPTKPDRRISRRQCPQRRPRRRRLVSIPSRGQLPVGDNRLIGWSTTAVRGVRTVERPDGRAREPSAGRIAAWLPNEVSAVGSRRGLARKRRERADTELQSDLPTTVLSRPR